MTHKYLYAADWFVLPSSVFGIVGASPVRHVESVVNGLEHRQQAKQRFLRFCFHFAFLFPNFFRARAKRARAPALPEPCLFSCSYSALLLPSRLAAAVRAPGCLDTAAFIQFFPLFLNAMLLSFRQCGVEFAEGQLRRSVCDPLLGLSSIARLLFLLAFGCDPLRKLCNVGCGVGPFLGHRPQLWIGSELTGLTFREKGHS